MTMKFSVEPILGVNITPLTYEMAVSRVRRAVASRDKKYICVASVHLVMECQKNALLRKGVNNAMLVTPDGMPLVWLLRNKGLHTERVYGPTLMNKLCGLAQKTHLKIFLVGGSLGEGRMVAAALKRQYPELTIVGHADTPNRVLSQKTNARLISQINARRPDIVFVGMGCPHQELWMIQYRHVLRASILVGVGAAFDFLAGFEHQAPPFIQKIGLEWLYRFIQHPRRLSQRYTLELVQFIFLLLSHSIGNLPFFKFAKQNGSD